MDEVIKYFLYVGSGIELTLELLLGAFLLGVFLGLLVAILKYNKIGNFILDRLVSILRGTPLILQLGLIYYALPKITGFKPTVLSAGIIALGLNSSAYVSEILRSGIENLPKGQFEAAKTLKVPSFYMWKDIILPQVIRNILPSIVNEAISLLKETALISTIGGMDLMRRSQTLAAEQFDFFTPLCIAGLYYYFMVLLIEFAGKKLEKKVAYVKNK
ncbi:MAG: amino acid ABC transporter permease [Pseudomonadota bacterium]